MQLEICNLNTYYGESHILQGVDLKVARGEFVALLGRNGMGKSTTLKSIMGMVVPKSGTITFEGKNITGLLPYKVSRAGIAYVPEERRIFSELTVKDNLLLGVKGGKPGDTSDPKVWFLERIFEHFPKLKERENSEGRHLSGGEQQMLAIGRALMGNPRLLLVDEPSEGLAPLMVMEVQNVLADINKAGVTILLVEHNLRMALSLAGRVCLMGKGHIGYEGTSEDLIENKEMREKYLEV
jgi:branched-chain amino acid transport system ATP-binding protein